VYFNHRSQSDQSAVVEQQAVAGRDYLPVTSSVDMADGGSFAAVLVTVLPVRHDTAF